MKLLRIAVACCWLVILHSPALLLAQRNVLENTEDKLKAFNAHQDYYKGEIKKAIQLYRELITTRPTDPEMYYWLGECYFAQNDFEHAKEYLVKATNLQGAVPAELHLTLGKTYQQLGFLDKAISEFDTYKKLVSNPKKIKESEVDHYQGQCVTAKELMAHPVNVKIENLGAPLNSPFDDKRPSITLDGKKMIFTSRRPREKDSPVDKEGDGKYFEDIYISNWDTVAKNWAEPELIPGAINTEYHDAACSISPDGKQIFVYKNDPLEARGGDIWVSKLSSSGRWGAPKPMGPEINTTYWEDGACLSPDGNTLYFISEGKLKGAMGKGDIYMCVRKTKNGAWGPATNLGPEINTEYDEGGVYIAADNKTLFFCSEGHNSMGSYDIFKTVNENGIWSKPVNIGYPINTTGAEKSFILTASGKVAYIASDRPGGLGERDIYKVDMSNYNVLESAHDSSAPINPLGYSILKGKIFSSQGAVALSADVKFLDESGVFVAQTHANAEDGGAYFITLLGNKKYKIQIEAEGYTPIVIDLVISAKTDGISTQIKDFSLDKKH